MQKASINIATYKSFHKTEMAWLEMQPWLPKELNSSMVFKTIN